MADTTTKRHPIRGFLYGIVFGLGLALIVIGQSMAALGTWPPFIVFIVGVVLGTLWGTYGPAKAPKGPPPSGATVEDVPAPAPAPEAEPEPAPVGAEAAAEEPAPDVDDAATETDRGEAPPEV